MSDTKVKETSNFHGYVIIEELVPGTDIIVSREEGENIICHTLADNITTALSTGAALPAYNYMAISADTGAAARATSTIPGSMTPTITKWMSTIITPSVDNTTPTSKITWIFTFLAGAGKGAVAKFGMEKTDTGSGACANEYLFSVTKDNLTNDLKITYTMSIAP